MNEIRVWDMRDDWKAYMQAHPLSEYTLQDFAPGALVC